MAKQDAEKFLEYLSGDISMQNQLLSMSGMDGILDCAFTKGYVFTESDLRQALKDYPENRAVDKLRTKLNIQAANRPAQAGKP
jgi:hypothetical protein